MRCLILIAMAFIALAAATDSQTKPANKDLLMREKKVLMLLNNIAKPTVFPEIQKIGTEFKIDSDVDLYKNKMVLKDFIRIMNRGLLPKSEIFTMMSTLQMKEAIALFNLMYYARDWDTLYKVASWARVHVNSGIFVYSFALALRHREDTRDIVLPPIYEIYPYLFVETETIQKANIVKMQGTILDKKVAEYYGMTKKDNVVIIRSNNTGWLLNTDLEQTKLSYFTEDVGLNSAFYHLHVLYPSWMKSEEYGKNKDKHGRVILQMHQQLIARYYLERLSNGMGEVPTLLWHAPLKVGYIPSLMYHTGLELETRPENAVLATEENAFNLDVVEDLERRLRQVIASKSVKLPDDTILKLDHTNEIGILGNILQGNMDSVNIKYYGRMHSMVRRVMNTITTPILGGRVLPTAFNTLETTLRDPVAWELIKRMIRYSYEYKNSLPAYEPTELMLKGVTLENVVVDKLVTFFDHFDIDITTTTFMTPEERENQKYKNIFIARKMRLNHEPFTVKMELKSEVTTDAAVRIYLGPKYDSHGKRISLNDNRFNFVMLDVFKQHLKTGKNIIERKSADFVIDVPDRVSTRDLVDRVEHGLKGEEVHLETLNEHARFPERLILPRGRQGGMVFQLFVVVSPITTEDFIQSLPLEYPLDRPIHDEVEFMVPNMLMKDVVIYHKTPMMVEDERLHKKNIVQ